MSAWQDRAKIAVRDVLSVGNIARWGWLFVSGARWQREALLTPEAVERVAHGIHASHDRGCHFEAEDHAVQEEYGAMARAALTAAIGGQP